MKRIYENLKALISPEMVSKASRVLEEKEANVTSASSSIIASLLGVMLKKGDTQQIENIFREAGNLDILEDIADICEEKLTHEKQHIGDDFLQHLLGDKAVDFTTPIAKQSGISEVATNRLISILAPIVAGYFGQKIVKDGWSMSFLMDKINAQKNTFDNYIPSRLAKAFNLSTVIPAGVTDKNEKGKPEKKNNGWVIWVVIIALLLLFFWAWRSCKNNRIEVIKERTTVANVTPTVNSETIVLTLPNGVNINVRRGGIEEQMVNFLNSDEYKNASDEDLANKWFVFDNINFEFDSSTQLMDGSQTQLDNIVAILKAYPHAKVKLGAFADKVGTEEVNMVISQERAKTIENLLDNAGVGAQVIRIEGYGEECAIRSPNAPDAERAKDRDIAIRFIR